LLDQLEGAAEHVSQRVSLAAAGKAPLQRILAFAGERGWRRLRLLSSARTTYNRDYIGETAEGHQRPMLNVFHRDGETIRHFGPRSFSTHQPSPGKIPATSAPSSRSGTCTTSPQRAAEPTGMSNCALRLTS
jgi:predicted dithiol-disulfide oxidoreductase (DUF899 family)